MVRGDGNIFFLIALGETITSYSRNHVDAIAQGKHTYIWLIYFVTYIDRPRKITPNSRIHDRPLAEARLFGYLYR